MIDPSHIAGRGAVSPSWEQLTRVGRLRRMRRLAEAALRHYDLPGARLSFLRAGDNLLYRVTTPSGEHFLLRLHEFSRRNADELRSELLWLTALRHEGRLIVPEPILTRDEMPFAEVTSDDVPGSRRCVLLRWVTGQNRAGRLTLADAHRMGMCMAQLHNLARGWSAPAGFARPRWEPEHWLGVSSPLWARGAQVYTRDELAIIAAAARRIRTDLRALGETPETYGIIHADLAPSNIVFDGGAAHAIDFEECGWGYYLFDIAVALTALADYEERGERLRDAFLDGYQRLSPALGAGTEFIETFMALVIIKIVAWVLGWDGSALRPREPDYLVRAVTRLRHYAERVSGTMPGNHFLRDRQARVSSPQRRDAGEGRDEKLRCRVG